MSDDRLIPRSGFLREWVDLYTPQGEAPASAHLGAGLALLSAAVGWRAWVRWGERKEPCTLTVVLEGRSATARKTTTAYAAENVARRAMKDHDPDDAGVVVRSMSHTSDRGLYELIGTADQKTAEKWEREPPPGHLIVWDEFGAVLGRPGDVKASDWLGRVRAALMVLSNGRHGGIQTGGSKVLPARCSVSLLGTMTRMELEQRMSHGLIGDGFLGRMALVPIAGRRAYLAEPPPWTQRDSIARDRLVAFVQALAGSPDCMGEVFDHFTPDAHDLRETWYVERTRDFDERAQSGSEVDLARVTAHDRLQAMAVKLAALGAIADRDLEADISQTKITDEHVGWGIWFAEYALQEVVELAVDAGGSLQDRYARKVVDYLRRRNGSGPVSRKQLLDDCTIDGLNRSQRWAVVEGMQQDSTVVFDAVKTAGRPRMDVALAEATSPHNPSADAYADTKEVGH